MTDNNAAKPAETAAGEKKVGPIRQWIKDHPNIWEFILFNVLSNISTITRFVVTWIGTAIFISGLGLTQPFYFLIFNYDTKGNGLGGFLTFLLAEVLAQVVNFFVQMKWVFKSDSSFKDAAWKYVILAVIIVVVNLVLPGYVTGLGHERRHRRHDRIRGQHLACRDRQLSAAQVLGHAEERVQGDGQERGGRQVALF